MNAKNNCTDAKQGVIRSPKLTTQILMDKAFFFPEGLPAFEAVQQFIFACKPETAPFIFMRALDPAHLGFVCIDPFLICPGFKLDLSNADTAFLGITNPEEILILSIVTPSQNVRQTTANLQSPLVINLRAHRGRQIIGAEHNYPVRYSIWEALKGLAQEAQTTAADTERKRSAA